MKKIQRTEQESHSTMFMAPKIVPLQMEYMLLPTVAPALYVLDECKSFA